MTRAIRMVRLATVVGFEAGALTFLLGLGRRPWMHIHWADFGSWIRFTTSEDAIAAFLWWAALGCMVWLGGSTLLYLVARVSRVPVLIRSVGWMTLPAIRRATERAVGTVLVASNLAAVPVRADPPPPVVMMIDHDGSLRPPGLGAHAPDALEDPAGPVESTFSPLPGFPDEAWAPDRVVEPRTVTVRSGDNLWIICRRHLTDALGRPATNEEIVPLWRRVIAHNRPNLISGNPDLIYAGEVIAMPPSG